MTYTLSDLAWVLKTLSDSGFKFVLIGSTVVDLELRVKKFEDDIDLFALEPSPLIEEDVYRSKAEEHGWTMSQTSLGTPKFIIRVPSGSEVVVEFYENIHDFYIPIELLDEAPYKSIGGVKVKTLRPEDYIVLKAKAGREIDIEDLRIIKEYIDSGKLRINERVLKKDISLMPEEDKPLIVRRLKSIGFRV